MVKKQSFGNPQIQIRIDREILAVAEEKLGGRRGVGRYIKAQLASEFDAPGDAYLQALKALNVKTLALTSKTAAGIGEVAGALKGMVEHLDKLESTLKRIEGNYSTTQRAILLLAERVGVVEARGSGSPEEG